MQWLIEVPSSGQRKTAAHGLAISSNGSISVTICDGQGNQRTERHVNFADFLESKSNAGRWPRYPTRVLVQACIAMGLNRSSAIRHCEDARRAALGL